MEEADVGCRSANWAEGPAINGSVAGRRSRHRRFQAAVLLLELLQSAHFGRHEPTILLAPAVTGLLRNASLPAPLLDTAAGVSLLQNESHPLFAEPRLPHGSSSRCLPGTLRENHSANDPVCR